MVIKEQTMADNFICDTPLNLPTMNENEFLNIEIKLECNDSDEESFGIDGRKSETNFHSEDEIDSRENYDMGSNIFFTNKAETERIVQRFYNSYRKEKEVLIQPAADKVTYTSSREDNQTRAMIFGSTEDTTSVIKQECSDFDPDEINKSLSAKNNQVVESVSSDWKTSQITNRMLVDGIEFETTADSLNDGANHTDTVNHSSFEKDLHHDKLNALEIINADEPRFDDDNHFKCPSCLKSFESSTELKTHLTLNPQHTYHSCTVCWQLFDTNYALNHHMKIHDKAMEHLNTNIEKTEAQYVCIVCKKRFCHYYLLEAHKTSHTNSKECRCYICNKLLSSMQSLKSHLMVHLDIRPFKCSWCYKTFNQGHLLKSHTRIHTGERPYKCTICDKLYTSSASLYNHKKFHVQSPQKQLETSPKRSCNKKSEPVVYRCSYCEKVLYSFAKFNRHEKKHRDGKFVVCNICGKYLASKQSLVIHVRSHTGEKPYKCLSCNKAYSQSHCLKQHKFSCNGEIIQTAPESEREISEPAVFKCSYCEKIIYSFEKFTRHENKHKEGKLVVCSICGKYLSNNQSLSIHMRSHTGEKPYVCSFCNKAYSQSHCLKQHMIRCKEAMRSKV